MLKWVRRVGLTLAPLGLLAKIFINRWQARSSPDESRLLAYLTSHTSAPVPELSSQLKLPLDKTLRVLADLERRGLVQLSGDQGLGHVRIAAITKAGREITA